MSHSVIDSRNSGAAAAAAAVNWPGNCLLAVRVNSFLVSPVVVIGREVARQRVSAGHGPETDPSTLAVWEGWAADIGPMPPPSAVTITGFVSADAPRRALYALNVLAGYGGGLILTAGVRRPSRWTMRECDLAGVSLVWCRRGVGAELLVQGRCGPVSSARRTVATRQKEELIFAHALRSGVIE